MHASSDIRTVKCLDGLHYSFEMLAHVYSSLYDVCSSIKDDQSLVIPALWQCWSFIDILHRVREIAQVLPGLNKNNKELKIFLKATEVADYYRNYIQHLREELSNKEINPFPVWGSLSWVDPGDPTLTYLIMIGARVSGTSYTGCVFDRLEEKWVSKVCLGIGGKSFNFDPIFEACIRFREFIIPWTLSAYKPGIRVTTELPLSSIQYILSEDGPEG